MILPNIYIPPSLHAYTILLKLEQYYFHPLYVGQCVWPCMSDSSLWQTDGLLTYGPLFASLCQSTLCFNATIRWDKPPLTARSHVSGCPFPLHWRLIFQCRQCELRSVLCLHSSALDVFEQLVLIPVSQIDMCNEVLPRGLLIFLKSGTDNGTVKL